MSRQSAAGSDYLATVPGRNFVAWLIDEHGASPTATPREYVQSLTTAHQDSRAQLAISTYVYGDDGMADALVTDPLDPLMVAMADALASDLTSPMRDTFTSPQRHSGDVAALMPPQVLNRRSHTAVLPHGALWTATPLTETRDTWSGSRESTPAAVYELHFTPPNIRVTRIDSAADWSDLIARHPRNDTGTRYPDWECIAKNTHAVHLSLARLLAAHPRLADRGEPHALDGASHSHSGPWAGVSDWSTVSTAWMTLPEHTWNVVTEEQDRS